MKSYTAFRGVVRQTMGVVGDGDASEALVLARVEEDLCSGNLPDLDAIETRLRERLARLHAGSALAWYAAMGLQVLAALRSAQAHGDWQRACGLYYRLGEFEKLAAAQAIFTPVVRRQRRTKRQPSQRGRHSGKVRKDHASHWHTEATKLLKEAGIDMTGADLMEVARHLSARLSELSTSLAFD